MPLKQGSIQKVPQTQSTGMTAVAWSYCGPRVTSGNRPGGRHHSSWPGMCSSSRAQCTAHLSAKWPTCTLLMADVQSPSTWAAYWTDYNCSCLHTSSVQTSAHGVTFIYEITCNFIKRRQKV